MSEFRLIAMPYELDRLRYGVGRGPERLLEAGAAEALAGAGGTLQPRFVELSEAHDSETDACFGLMRLVADEVRAARNEGRSR